MEMFDENQKLTGLDYDLAQALGAKLGVRLELQTQAFDSIIPSLQSGKHDVIMSGMNDTAGAPGDPRTSWTTFTPGSRSSCWPRATRTASQP